MAEVEVTLPQLLLRLFPAATKTVALEAVSVAGAMDALEARWPGMRDRLCDSRPAIRRHIKVFVDGEVATLRTPLRQGAEVLVMTAVSGG